MWKDKLKAKFEENPLETIAVAALAVNAASKLLDTVSAVQGRKAYAKQVNYRVKRK